MFTKHYGFRFSSIDHKFVAEPACVAEIDFTRDSPGVLGSSATVVQPAITGGPVHAVLCYWEVFAPGVSTSISTSPAATIQNFPRDMQWGQAIQLVEDYGVAAAESRAQPTTLWVEEGDLIAMQIQFSEDSVLMSFRVGLAAQMPEDMSEEGDEEDE